MASENNNFQSTVNSLFKGMDSFITTKTVVGDAITVGDTIILSRLVLLRQQKMKTRNRTAAVAWAEK